MLRRVATEPSPPNPSATRTLDVGTVLRKSFELIGNRPLPLLGAAAIAQLPLVVASLALVPMVAPFAERMQRALREGTTDPSAILGLVVDQLPAILGVGIGMMVLMYAFYVVQIGAVMQVVVDAYRRRPSSVGSALRAGLRRAPSLFVYTIVKQLSSGVAFLGGVFLMVVPLAFMHTEWSGREFLAVLSVIAGCLVGAIFAFEVWSMLSLGAGAIVAEGIGPFAGLARGFRLARGRPWMIAFTWLATASSYFLGLCLVGCFSGMITAPVQMGFGSIASAVIGQLIQFVPQVAMACVTHTVGAIMYGELAGLEVPESPADIADVFR